MNVRADPIDLAVNEALQIGLARVSDWFAIHTKFHDVIARDIRRRHAAGQQKNGRACRGDAR